MDHMSCPNVEACVCSPPYSVVRMHVLGAPDRGEVPYYLQNI